MIKDENNSEEAIINKAKSSIERNFGGQELSVNEVINLFFTQCNSTNAKLDKQQYDVMKCITDNITDYDSRYLLIVSKASTSHFLVTNVLRKNNADYEMYIGSRFENDENEQFYKANMISKIPEMSVMWGPAESLLAAVNKSGDDLDAAAEQYQKEAEAAITDMQ